MKKKLIPILIIIALIIGPLLFINGAYEGSDGQGEEKIEELSGGYEPWFKSIWTPQSGEVESLLFSLQAAAGAGFIGYYIGKKTKNDKRSNDNSKTIQAE